MLDGLEDFVDSSSKLDGISQVYYFFLERGVTPQQLDELPIPWIIEMLKTHTYVMKQQEKAAKRKR